MKYLLIIIVVICFILLVIISNFFLKRDSKRDEQERQDKIRSKDEYIKGEIYNKFFIFIEGAQKEIELFNINNEDDLTMAKLKNKFINELNEIKTSEYFIELLKTDPQNEIVLLINNLYEISPFVWFKKEKKNIEKVKYEWEKNR